MQQRRGRSIQMAPDDLDAFLNETRTCRVGTTGKDGHPHVSPLWFLWNDGALWFSSLVRSQRWTNLERNPQIMVLVDSGDEYSDLRGVQLSGRIEVVSAVPHAIGHGSERLAAIEARFAEKYGLGATHAPDGRHAWVRLVPTRAVSWDFRKSREVAARDSTAAVETSASPGD